MAFPLHAFAHSASENSSESLSKEKEVVKEKESVILNLMIQASQQKLSEDPHWLALGHYKKKGNRYVSEILPAFFLAKNGFDNPLSELEATLKAFITTPMTGKENEHAQCRYIARFHWLKTKLEFPKHFQPLICTDYKAWRHNDAQQASIIYATGYLKNPASFYGHVLLRFYSEQPQPHGSMLDTSINYGALVDPNDNALVYIFKGVFGGYQAAFSHGDFYHYHFNYAENELRNLWEYALVLDVEQVDILAQHAWELHAARFSYYFIQRNCAYYMAELLELVLKTPMQSKTPWKPPVNIFHTLAEKNKKNSLIKSVNYIPSRQNKYVNQYQTLNQRQKKVVLKLNENQGDFFLKDYVGLQLPEKIKVVDTLLDYSEYLMVTDQTEKNKSFKKRIVVERLKLPPEAINITSEQTDTKKEKRTVDTPPHTGDKTTLMQLSVHHQTVHHQNTQNDFYQFRLRPAAFDLLSLTGGRTPFTTLEMFDTHLTFHKDRLSLRTLEFLHLEALTPLLTPLPQENNFAWRVRLAIEQESFACLWCSLFTMDAGIGKSFALNQQIAHYYLIEGVVHDQNSDQSKIAIQPRLGIASSIGSDIFLSMYLNRRIYLDGKEKEKTMYGIETRFFNHTAFDLQLFLQKDIEKEYGVRLSYKL